MFFFFLYCVSRAVPRGDSSLIVYSLRDTCCANGVEGAYTRIRPVDYGAFTDYYTGSTVRSRGYGQSKFKFIKRVIPYFPCARDCAF